MATVGGNLLQRTRCFYFYDPGYRECNKRAPGSGCAALDGLQPDSFGSWAAAITASRTHPSDMAVALAALDAIIQVHGSRGSRSIPFADFYRLPARDPHLETNLSADELITAVDLPASSAQAIDLFEGSRSQFLCVRAGVGRIALKLDDQNRIEQVRIALGGVAPEPWRVREAEEVLSGKGSERIELPAGRGASCCAARNRSATTDSRSNWRVEASSAHCRRSPPRAERKQMSDAVGQPLDRVDGRLKVTEKLRTRRTTMFPDLRYAVLVTSRSQRDASPSSTRAAVANRAWILVFLPIRTGSSLRRSIAGLSRVAGRSSHSIAAGRSRSCTGISRLRLRSRRP